MFTNQTGWLKWQLPVDGGSNPNPALTQGQPTTFSMRSIPAVKDGLAVYLGGLMLTITGTLTQAGGTGVRQLMDTFIRNLIQSVNLSNCMHGSPISAQWQRGEYLYWAEFIGNGYRRMQPTGGALPAANGVYNFNIRIFLPLMNGAVVKPHHTMNLAFMFNPGVFAVNVAPAATITANSPGATLTALTARLTAYCLLDPEVRLGPAIEFVEYQSVTPASASIPIEFRDFGNLSSLTGTTRGAGVAHSFLASSNIGQGGFSDFATLLRFGLPWRGQPDIDDIGAFLDEARDAMGPHRQIGSVVDQAAAVGTTLQDVSGWPNVLGAERITANANAIQAGTVLGIPIVNMGSELELTKIQRVNQAIIVNTLFSAAPLAGVARAPTFHVREWSPEFRSHWREQVINEKIAEQVLGRAENYDWALKTLNKNETAIVGNEKKIRFMPYKLVPRRANLGV